MTVGMSGQLGKVPREFLEDVVFKNLGADRDSVLTSPGHGLDNAVISLGESRVLIVTTDPLSIIPSIGIRESAWLSVNLLASDLATSGVMPQFAALDLNLPPELGPDELESYVSAIGDECKRLGIAIVGGHTGRYPGSGYTVVGGGTMFSVAARDSYVTPAMARRGDAVLITNGAATGATAVLSNAFPRTVGEIVGKALLNKAKSLLRDCSTVEDALVAASLGLREKVTSMHDATEGGVLGGLYELSSACGCSIQVDREKVHVSKEVASVCGVFGLDPLTSLSEGTLIITCDPRAVEEVRSALAKKSIPSFAVGEVRARSGRPRLWVSSGGSKPQSFQPPSSDAYWEAYSEAAAKGLR
ncbi:MAG: AIR synthase family protein [Thaumarchaeota archaeon]|nr:AIR synthase family protein [Nitrososphaerota archaeon]